MNRTTLLLLVSGGAAGLLAAAPRPVQAQKALVTVSAGYGVAPARWPTFTRFLDGYHAYQGKAATSPARLDRLTVWSARACAFGMLSVGYDQARADLRTGFSDGGTRYFNVRHNLLTVAVEPSFQREHFFVGLVGGLGFGTLRVETPYRYADGTLSYGAEVEINGVYRATSVTPYFGGKVGVSYKHLALTLRAEQFVAGNLSGDFTLSDQTVYNLPTDYARYVRTGATLYGPDNVVTADLSTLRLQVQLGYMLAFRDDD